MVDKEEVTLIVYDIWEQVRLQGLGKGITDLASTWMTIYLSTGLSPGSKPTLGCLSQLAVVTPTVRI